MNQFGIVGVIVFLDQMHAQRIGRIVMRAVVPVLLEDRLQPLDDLTPDQRFFVGYGQSWCGETRDETKRMRATIDPHSPEKYRTNGVVSNMPEFQQAFHCKADAPMVNKNRCRVW